LPHWRLCSFGSEYTFLVVQSNSLIKSQIILLIVYEWDDQTKEGMGKAQRKRTKGETYVFPLDDNIKNRSQFFSFGGTGRRQMA